MLTVAKILAFVRTLRGETTNVTDIEVDIGGGDIRTAEHFSTPGDDSFPLKTDYTIVADMPRGGGKAAVGYIDPVNTPLSKEGDKRVYGRNPDGTTVNQVWLQNDGSVVVSNDKGSIILNPDGGSIAKSPKGTFNVNADGSIKGSNDIGSFELQAGGDVNINGAVIDTQGNITSPGMISAPQIAAITPSGSLTIRGVEMYDHKHAQGNDSAGDTQVNTSGPV
ncbi:MAG: hypothetical protein K0U20_08995 [Proteobacteria bacterium]|nr:hypothetical protein [Pseudomonadota bacterium]